MRRCTIRDYHDYIKRTKAVGVDTAQVLNQLVRWWPLDLAFIYGGILRYLGILAGPR